MFGQLGLIALLFFLSAEAAIAAPPQLRGKSVVVRWTENRVQRLEGQEAFRPFTTNIEVSTYVSEKGQVFNRLQSTGSHGGINDQVGGEKGSRRIPTFHGNKMTIIQGFGRQGLARRTHVEFDGSFTSCTANVITGIQTGAAAGYMRPLGRGPMQEIKSVTVGGTSCSIVAGNVFR